MHTSRDAFHAERRSTCCIWCKWERALIPPRLIPAATAAADLPAEVGALTAPPRPTCPYDEEHNEWGVRG